MKQNPSITVASYKIPYNYKPSVYDLMHMLYLINAIVVQPKIGL